MVIFNSGSCWPVWICCWSDMIACPDSFWWYLLRNNCALHWVGSQRWAEGVCVCVCVCVWWGEGGKRTKSRGRPSSNLLRIRFLESVHKKALCSVMDPHLHRATRQYVLRVQILVQYLANSKCAYHWGRITFAATFSVFQPFQLIWSPTHAPHALRMLLCGPGIPSASTLPS